MSVATHLDIAKNYAGDEDAISIIDELRKFVDEVPKADLDEINTASSRLTHHLIAVLPQENEVVDDDVLSAVLRVAHDSAHSPTWKVHWAFRKASFIGFADMALCPLSSYISLAIEDASEISLGHLLGMYWCLWLLRDGIIINSESSIYEGIERSDNDTAYLDYFIVKNEISRIHYGNHRIDYVCMKFTGGKPDSLYASLCRDKREVDSVIASFREEVGRLGSSEPRAGDIAHSHDLVLRYDPEPQEVKQLRRVDSWRGFIRHALQVPSPNVSRIVIRPVGDIQRVPFEALGRDDDLYGERYATIQSAVCPLLDQKPDRKLLSLSPGLIIGACEFDAAPAGESRIALIPQRRRLFEPLARSEAEVREVAKIIAGEVLLSADTTKHQIVEAVAKLRPRILHFATHAFNAERQTHDGQEGRTITEAPRQGCIYNGIALSGANAHIDHAGECWVNEEGILEASDLVGLDLSGTELVVLSACESGLSAVETGIGGEGLRETFLDLGVLCVVSSVWSVNDADAHRFMTCFYRQLNSGYRVSESLKRARCLLAEMRDESRFAFVALGYDISIEGLANEHWEFE